MVFDFLILVICASRLWSIRGSGGSLSSLLLRDGIGYFVVTFVVNLVATILGGIELNPVLSVISLPFTVIVSVIASTTVFCNVFLLSGNFSSNHAQDEMSVGEQRATFGRSGGFRASKLTSDRDHFALRQTRTAASTGDGIEVHKVVEIDVERENGSFSFPSHKAQATDDDLSISENQNDNKV